MEEKYTKITAIHYAAYRPPLHELILKESLPIDAKFENGLDLGCGTGVSTVVLTSYCTYIYGVDPSEAMLKKTNSHEKITFLQGAGYSIPLPNTIIDLVTFAGSLFYAKSNVLIEELRRVCHNQAIILIYDFKVLLEDVLAHFDIKLEEIPSNYDYQTNFDDTADFKKINSKIDQIKFPISANNLAHTMLGDSIIYESLFEKFNRVDPYHMLVNYLEELNKQWVLKANTYYWVYQLNVLR